MTPALREILSKFGAMPGFSTCECAHCFGMREVERRATTRQAFHSVMGADLFEAIAADMGVHWALVAAFTAPKCGEDSPAFQALCAISKADVEMIALIRKHENEMSALEMLAVGANMVGKLLALQDQTTTTPAAALQVISTNIEIGNAQAIAGLMQSEGAA